jgi:hypothetical protein
MQIQACTNTSHIENHLFKETGMEIQLYLTFLDEDSILYY